MANPFLFNETQINRLFPFYILINKELKVIAVGKSLGKFCDLKKAQHVHQFFSIPRPLTSINSFDDLIALQDQLVVMELATENKLKLRGQFEYMEATEEILFLGSPWFNSMEQVRENNLLIGDFAKNDPLIDLLHVLKTVEITNDDLKELLGTVNRQRNELKTLNKEYYDIALFTKQNPDPNLRINYEGDIIQNNPAASNLDFIEYEGNSYRIDLFFKLIASRIDVTAKRWNVEANSNGVDYSFDFVAMPNEGYINIYGSDITEKKINQQELEKLSLIVQETMNAVIITNSRGKIDWVNKSFEKMTGFSLNEVKGKVPGVFLQGDETNREVVDYMRQQIKEAKAFTCEIYNYKKTGEGYWLRINGQAIFDKNGKLTNFFAIEEDITLIKESQEKINTAASRMSSLISNLQSGIILENKNKTIELVNNRFCELFNVKSDPEDLRGIDCSNTAENIKPLFKKQKAFIQRIDKIISDKKLVLGDQLEMKNGQILERSYIPIWNDAVYEGHLWVYSDITDKVNANKKINELRVFYEKILDNIPSDIAVFDKEHHYLYVNPKAIKNSKIRNWIVGKTDEDYIQKRNKPRDILKRRKEIFSEVLDSKQLKSWEEKFKQPDDTYKYVMRNMYPVLNSNDEVDLVIGYGVDITDIKTIQQQIEQSEKTYRDLIDNSLAIITTHNLDGKILSSNPMAGKVYGYSKSEYVGHLISDFLIEEDKHLFKENYLKLIKANKTATGTLRVLNKEGKIVYTLYNNYLKEERGKEPYIISSAVDITTRVLSEKELIKSKNITEELARSKHNFLANMSHEIRTPMNAIMGMSRQLQKSNLNNEQQSYLTNISTASENLLVIINDILDLSKLEANKLSFEKIGFKPKLVIGNALKVMQHKAEEKGIKLTNSFCDMQLSPILIGDPYRINQILLNIVSNAIKFTDVGSVDITCKVLKDHGDFQNLEMKITDTGIGMDSIFLNKLFEKFTQEYETKSKNYGGTGLGMAITKSLIDNMGGEILVESEKNKGTTVSIRFTLFKGTEADLKKKKNIVKTSNYFIGKKVLVVDDNVMNRMVATLILKELKVVISEVGDGEEAVNYLKNNECDLVLMDLQMPVLNGYDATKKIRKKLKLKVPIIALTANVIEGEKEKCFKVGMNDYLSKPFDEEQFIQIVSNWLEKKEDVDS